MFHYLFLKSQGHYLVVPPPHYTL